MSLKIEINVRITECNFSGKGCYEIFYSYDTFCHIFRATIILDLLILDKGKQKINLKLPLSQRWQFEILVDNDNVNASGANVAWDPNSVVSSKVSLLKSNDCRSKQTLTKICKI